MVDIDLPYHRHDYNIKYDSNVFPRECNRMIKIGWWRKRWFMVKCNGDGTMSIVLKPTQTIEEVYELYKKGMITKSEYEAKKKELLDSIN